MIRVSACSKYENIIEQKKRADQEAAERLLNARKEARRCHDELMRKPWRKPSAPTKDILKRGDGARRRRAALRRSIEEAAGQVEKTLPAVCRWNRATNDHERGIREFIDEQRAARKRDLSLAAPAEARQPLVPWNDVKATAQQRLQDLVRGQCFGKMRRNSHSSEGPLGSEKSPSRSDQGGTLNSHCCMQPQQACATREAPQILENGSTTGVSAQSMSSQGLHADKLSLPAMYTSDQLTFDGRLSLAVQGRQACPNSIAAGLPVSFGDLLRQSMCVVDVENQVSQHIEERHTTDQTSCCTPHQGGPALTQEGRTPACSAVDMDSQRDGIANVNDFVDGPPTDMVLDKSSGHATRSVINDFPSHPATVTEQPASVDAAAAGVCATTRYFQSHPDEKKDVMQPGTVRHANAAWLGIEACQKHSCSDPCGKNMPIGSNTQYGCSEVSNKSLVRTEEHTKHTCQGLGNSGSPTARTGPMPSSHSVRLQMLMEKMQNLQQLHRHVQQELQITRAAGSVAAGDKNECCGSLSEQALAYPSSVQADAVIPPIQTYRSSCSDLKLLMVGSNECLCMPTFQTAHKQAHIENLHPCYMQVDTAGKDTVEALSESCPFHMASTTHSHQVIPRERFVTLP